MKGSNMPRAVKPWTWRLALRDHGPRRQGLLLTLYTLGTFMNKNGFAYPGQATLARGARASVRTIRRHMQQAEALGWVGMEFGGKSGQGWRHYVYRAAVPGHVPLTVTDEALADALVAEFGEIEAADIIPTPPDLTSTETRRDPRCPDVRTTDAERADTIVSSNVRTQLVPTNSLQRTLVSTEGAPSSTNHNQSKIPEASHRYLLPDLLPLLSGASPGTDAGAVGYFTDEDLEAICKEYARLEVRTVSERWGRLRAYAEYDATQPSDEEMVVAGCGYTDDDLEGICEEHEWARGFLLQGYPEYEATALPEAA